MKRWVVTRKGADFDEIAKKYNISPYLARIIRNRDVIGDSNINLFLNGRVSDMHNPALFKDIDKAADIIADAIRNNERIRIIGDYDIDGICSSYILNKSFEILGADADVRLPDRVVDGYGLNMSMIDEAVSDGVSLIVTCDNGISASEEIMYAKSKNIKVVVTDHHEVPFDMEGEERIYRVPKADAVVDPKQADCAYPFKGICGGMVAYKFVVYITSQERFRDLIGGFTDEIMDELLVFAAFATVGDVMELLDENRVAVKIGLKLISSCSNVGLRALIDVCKLDKDNISAYHVGFVLGPCMNATGRLDSALRALELLQCKDYGQAVGMAQNLKEINESRKNMTLMFTDEAIKIADGMKDNVLVIYLPDCHESLAGIVAGRIREKYYKPAIVLTKSSEGVKGSGRSIDDYNMFEELSRVSELFTKFGGHKLAAGMSLNEENVDELRRRLNENAGLTEENLTEKYNIDIPLPISYVNLDFARELDRLSPYGVGNPRPLFAQKDVRVEKAFVVGKNRNVLKLNLMTRDSGGNIYKMDGVIFGDADTAYEDITARDSISILYQVDINSYMGRDKVQLIIKDYC